MAAPNASHMVGKCFVSTETGTYFEGTGYLKAGEKRHNLSWGQLASVCGHIHLTVAEEPSSVTPSKTPSDFTQEETAVKLLSETDCFLF